MKIASLVAASALLVTGCTPGASGPPPPRPTMTYAQGAIRARALPGLGDVLTTAGGTPAVVRLRTAAGRAQVAGWLDAFVTMYEPHEAREDTEVFPAFRQVTSDRQFALISEQVAEAQQRDYGDNAIAHFVGQIAGIEKTLGIHDLNSVTPPEPAHMDGH